VLHAAPSLLVEDAGSLRILPLQKCRKQWHIGHTMHISHNMQAPCEVPAVVVFGCGNVLFGDDGFGPAVIDRLQQFDLPETVRILDAGTSIREYLLDYLMLPILRPRLLVVVDAWSSKDEEPGQVRQCVPSDLPFRKTHDFSLHQFPTVNLLAELEAETGITVILVVAGTATLPDRIEPGLSSVMRAAVDIACEQLVRIVTSFTALEHATP
jgi:coenzyme F420 hydrogenase subunit delta